MHIPLPAQKSSFELEGVYIERKQREGDERSKFPHLTEKGAQLIEKAIPLVEVVDKDFFGKLKHDTKKCVEILQRLTEE